MVWGVFGRCNIKWIFFFLGLWNFTESSYVPTALTGSINTITKKKIKKRNIFEVIIMVNIGD